MRKARMFAAVATTAALALTTFGVATANAAELENGNVEKDKTLSVTFKKYDNTGADKGGKATGTDADATSKALGHPVRNVQFKLTPVKYVPATADAGNPANYDAQNIDLSSVAGWEMINKVNGRDSADPAQATTIDMKKVFTKDSTHAKAYFVKAGDATSITTKKTGDDGVTKVETVKPNSAPATTLTGAGDTTTTNNLTQTLYYVEEVDTTQAEYLNDSGEWVKQDIKTKMPAFLLALPMPNEAPATGFNYDVKVFPKNELTQTKTGKTAEGAFVLKEGKRQSVKFINTKSDAPATTIPWKITVDLGRNSEKPYAPFEKVGFSDPIQNGLIYNSVPNEDSANNKIGPFQVKIYKAEGDTNGTRLEAGDYVVKTYKTTTEETSTASEVKLVRFMLTNQGLGKLNGQGGNNKDAVADYAGGKLEAYVLTDVDKNAKNTADQGDAGKEVSVYDNYANMWNDDAQWGDDNGGENPVCVPNPAGATEYERTCKNGGQEGGSDNYGTFKLIKVAASSDLRLNDAQFDVFPVVAGSELAKEIQNNGTAKIVTKKKSDVSAQLEGAISDAAFTTAKTTYTKTTENDTTEQGIFFDKINLGKDADGKARESAEFCVSETHAPASYWADANNLTCFQVTKDHRTAAAMDVTIENSKDNLVNKIIAQLPKTGAAGLVLMTLAGALLIGAGFFAVAANRRREQE